MGKVQQQRTLSTCSILIKWLFIISSAPNRLDSTVPDRLGEEMWRHPPENECPAFRHWERYKVYEDGSPPPYIDLNHDRIFPVSFE